MLWRAETERFRAHSQGLVQFNFRQEAAAAIVHGEAQIADLHVKPFIVFFCLGPGKPGEIHEDASGARLQGCIEGRRGLGFMELLCGPRIYIVIKGISRQDSIGGVGLDHSRPLKWVRWRRKGSNLERGLFRVSAGAKESKDATVGDVAQAPEKYQRTEREHRTPRRAGFARSDFFRDQPQQRGKAETKAKEYEQQRVEDIHDVPGVPPRAEGQEGPETVRIREVHQKVASRSNPRQDQKPGKAQWRSGFRLCLAAKQVNGPCQQEGKQADPQDRMSDAAVILEIGRASPEARDDVDVRQVRSRDQSEGGKPGFAVQPGMAQGYCGKGVGKVVHGTSRNWKIETGKPKNETGKSKFENRKTKLENRNSKLDASFFLLPRLQPSIFDFRVSIFDFPVSCFTFRPSLCISHLLFSFFEFRFSIFEFRFSIFDFRLSPHGTSSVSASGTISNVAGSIPTSSPSSSKRMASPAAWAAQQSLRVSTSSTSPSWKCRRARTQAA